jgi:hypothetical protein
MSFCGPVVRTIIRIIYFFLYAITVGFVILTSLLNINCKNDLSDFDRNLKIIPLFVLLSFPYYLEYKDIPLYVGEMILHTFNYTKFYKFIVINDIITLIIFTTTVVYSNGVDTTCGNKSLYSDRLIFYIITALFYHISKLFVSNCYPEKIYTIKVEDPNENKNVENAILMV